MKLDEYSLVVSVFDSGLVFVDVIDVAGGETVTEAVM